MFIDFSRIFVKGGNFKRFFMHTFNALQHSCSLSQILNNLVSHFRLAIDCIAIQDGSLLAPQHTDADDLEMPYHPEEALQIVDMTMKLIKSISDHGGREHVEYIIQSCPDMTVIL